MKFGTNTLLGLLGSSAVALRSPVASKAPLDDLTHPHQHVISTPASLTLASSHPPPSTADLVQLHKNLVRIPSISGAEANATAWLADYLRARGFTVLIQPVAPGNGRANLWAYVGTTRQTRVLVTSHIDTVPPFWPYERKTADGRLLSDDDPVTTSDVLWGRGTVDAKGSVAALVVAVDRLLRSDAIREGDVALLVDVGEERGGDGIRAANRLGLAWEAVIFGEPTRLKLGRGHKGGLGFNVTAHGKAGHSGYPEQGDNAIDRLVRGLSALLGVRLPGSAEFGNTTLNIGTIHGGVAANVIPETAAATVSVRVAGGTLEGIQKQIAAAVLAVEPSLALDFAYGRGPISLDYDIDGFDTVVLNYGTDIPGLQGDHKKYLYGPGDILVAHSDHEHLLVADLEGAVEGYKTLITESLKRSRT
ncbi:acetylornithine deacetylase [Sporothrix schenckii 1099-18]|uniref:Peptidase M20 dimerisation domain-containing protein n=2 Tax=Sporothrix schenckii TaxID=29908 RepID=U7PZR8_SPOS1|nr:acetylornithine deacetylase [Sporothrix schenckii 1099-18]ERT00245.1 hypothetical protein HMPREF1624_03616 [Sporothrix schenckii ATCC 58251]KJR85294.1 acetylornithine deacetylase [Sporothrix schenckii 1099-18]